jgi:hypothetical protein
MVDVQKELLKDLDQKKLDNSVLQTDPENNNKTFQSAEMLIFGLEKDREVYRGLFLKHQFLQLKGRKQLITENLEVWIGYDGNKGDLFQIFLCFREKKDERIDAMTRSQDCINKVFKKNTKSRLPFKGPTIALIGSDGSGKSTVTNDLETWFSEKLDCRRYYLGSGDHYNPVYKRSIKMIRRLFKSAIVLNKQQKITSGRNELNQSEKKSTKKGMKNWYILLNAYYLYRFSVHSLKQLKKSYYFSEQGGICLFDRYPQNQFLGINDGPKIRKSYGDINSSMIKRLINKEEENIRKCVEMSPDLVIKLIISPEFGILRKPDHNIQELKKKSDIIHDLNFEHAVVQSIDANQKYEEELKTIKKMIWDYLFQLSKMNR